MSVMVSANTLAELAALIGDAGRANMLSALMGGQALTAGELAWHAGVTPQTASGHLAQMTAAHLLAVEKQGRHRYFRLATPEIAQLLESLMATAATGPRRHRPIGPKDEALRAARACYDHMAGRLGVGIAQSLSARGHLLLTEGIGALTDAGHDHLAAFGLPLDTAQGTKRIFCRACLDWSERRPHLGGALGAALFQHALDLGWIARLPDSRALRITSAGQRGFAARFGLRPDGTWPSSQSLHPIPDPARVPDSKNRGDP